MKQEHFAMDYVYNATETGELKSVRVALLTDTYNDFLAVEITSKEPVPKDDLTKILNELWIERFIKLKISLVTDCKISLLTNGKNYRIAVSQNSQTHKISVDELVEEYGN